MTFYVACVFAGAIVLAEIGLRYAGFGPSSVHTVTADEFVRVPGMYGPNQRLLVRQNRKLPYQVSINTLGFRGTAFTAQKPDGEFRIVVLGDSFTFGDYVDDEETLPARLQLELDRACSSVLVVNAGLSGSSIDSQYHIAMRSLAVGPDLALLVFYENDVAAFGGRSYWDRLASTRERKSRFPYSIIYKVARNTAFWTAFLRARANLSAAARADSVEALDTEDHSRVMQNRSLYAGHFRRLVQELASRQVLVAATAYPSHLTLRRNRSAEQLAWFADMTRRNGLPYIDVYAWLENQPGQLDSWYLLPWDGHPSRQGNAMVAAHVAQSN